LYFPSMKSIVFPLTVIGLALICDQELAGAQIRPDNALGSERSVLNINTIQGGAQRGNNLFHSFQEFSIGSGQRIDFANPGGVKNILTRVTDVPSKIDGTLGVLGDANLFLINPNGISFGAAARLDMSGIFVGSTANGLKFADGVVYGTTSNPSALLTSTVPVGLQFGRQPGGISLKDSLNLLAKDTTTNYGGSGFLLIGGDINLTNTRLITPESKIELVAINSAGTVSLDPLKLLNPQELSVIVPLGLTRADITLKNGTVLNTVGAVSGAVGLQARNIEISRTADTTRSVINTRTTSLSPNTKGGSVTLNATNNVSILGDFSAITTSPQAGSKINGGDISIKAQNLRVLDGAYLETSPFLTSTGAGGNVLLDIARTFELGSPGNGQESDILTNSYGSGNSGNITIYTGRFIQKDGAQISTNSLGSGDLNATGQLGSIKIVARESVDISGISPVMIELGFPNATGVTSFAANKKNAGNIDIQTPRFSLRNGAAISAGTDNTGAGGNISITGLNGRNALSVELLGNSNLSSLLGLLKVPEFADIGNGSRIRSITSFSGNAGTVAIKADQVTLQGGTRIDVGTIGSGQGGSIDIQTRNLKLASGGQLISTTSNSGQAGNIKVRSTNVADLQGVDASFATKRTFFSLFTTVNNESLARQALTDYLANPNTASQQAVVSYWSRNNSNIGDLQILQNYFSLLARDTNARSALQRYLVKTAGQKSIDYNLFLNASNNSGLVSRSRVIATGAGGNIVMNSPNLNINRGAAITANGDGTGQGGSIVVNANKVRLDRGSITAKTAAANGGDINLNTAQSLLLRDRSEISTSAAANGNGGNVAIQAPVGVVVAVPRENSDITASAIGGSGGTVKINALSALGFSFQVLDAVSNIAATSVGGAQGIVTVTSLDSEPSRGLQPDPIAPAVPSLSQVCPTSGNQPASTLINSGTGGVVPSPADLVVGSNLWLDERASTVQSDLSPVPAVPITVAQGWTMGRNRTVILTNLSPVSSLSLPVPDCHAR
jgi:filamentous hemagglutinin family protein